MSNIWGKFEIPLEIRLNNFEKYIRRQSMSRFLARYELFKLQMPVKGCIVECGVHHGGGLMGWAKMSSALEPYALDRRIFGFDTFDGFPSVSIQDVGAENAHSKVGGLRNEYDVYAELLGIIGEYDDNRYLNQFDKVFLVEGDACQTIPHFIQEQPYVLVSMLFLDFDLYEPTKVALEHFVPRMPKGAVLAFDELNNPWWPGETLAALGYLNLNERPIQRFTFDPNISYIVL
jgi:hypothetical protein